MVQRTLGDCIEPLSRVAGNTGLPVTDALVVEYLNNAIEELSAKGDFPGVVDRWYLRFDQQSGLVALPTHLERLMAVTVDDCPLEIRSPWYEFVQFGPGILRDQGADSQGNVRPGRINWVSVVADRGESPVQRNIPRSGGPYTLRIVTHLAEPDVTVGTGSSRQPTITICGEDPNGHVLRTLDPLTGLYRDGECLTVGTGAASAMTNGAAHWGHVTSVVRDQTVGPVDLYAVPASGAPTLLSTFEYNDTRPSYRRYFIPALYRSDSGVRDRVILARCRRRFVAVTDPGAVLMIGNLRALEAMIIAQYKASIGDFDVAGTQMSRAVQLMREEAEAHAGKARVPAVAFDRGFARGVVPDIR